MKKLLQLLKNDEEKQADIDNDSYYEEQSSKTISSSRMKMENTKNIEAKIAYQYPKGKFRFPLIPDEKAKEEEVKRPSSHPIQEWRHSEPKIESSRERKHQQQQHQQQHQHQAAPFSAVNHVEREEPVHKEKKPEKFKRSNRPFKPTEVPSPIYGYKRPETPVHRGRVEYELSSFESENSQLHMQVEDSTVINTVHVSEVPVRAAAVEESSMMPAKAEEKLENESETIIAIQPSAKYTDDTTVIETANEIQEPYVENQHIREIERTKYEPLENDSLPILEIHETAAAVELELEQEEPAAVREISDMVIEVELEPEQKEQAVVQEISDMVIEVELEPEQKEQAVVREISDTVIEAELEPEQEKSASVEKIHETVPAEVVLVKEESVPAQEIQEAAKTDVEQESAQEEPAAVPVAGTKEKTVSHLPFNVIMLKQDKHRLETSRKTSSFVQKKETPEHKVLPLKEPEKRELYQFPAIDLLSPPLVVEENGAWIEEQRELLNNTLKNFNVGAQVVNVTQGPSVTRFEVQPEPGVKVNKVTNLSDDIKLSLAARDIRIEAPIPGKHTIGIEVPNQKSRPVLLSEIINSPEFIEHGSSLTAALGLDISGKPIVTDLRKMPHGLIAGATGSGKSVCINTILVSLLYKAKPEELKLLLIDPKMVELAPYNQIPHLVSPVITDVKAATASLKWAVDEMERRYELFAHTGVRDIHRFNEQAEEYKRYADKLPYIVIIIDELADLMMMSPADVEEAICRIAQKARACGIHLIIATQRPSVDVITGLIKANIPTRIAFSVSSQIDSRTIIDMSGAEKLLGRGDMLFLENGSSKPVRLQGTFVSDQEIDEVVAHARKQGEPNYLFEQEELLKKTQISDEEDELFYEACEFVIDHGGASTSSLQRKFKIGYNRAARLIDMMEEQGFISESRGSKPRDVLITEEDLETIQESSIMN
ncbi:DNA translocase FtsK [Bacillus benzoevorans]|uniref:S-DNA-T family DNA segregation ATPase FtsK/SpoIIIE n=1 Tax=Bacillus benzoevorans TaxID=1456 RepID=A0A7X0HU44_9BACI|nr:DNA translocase FtsK [Bacillus benzoevorans]MBB6445745.1 S-DNA-T family DNA segregation ATPase FtsK/SpoIIIE [Bacillus benzoevorans]